MTRVVGILGALPRIIRYVLRLPFGALRVFFTQGWTGFIRSFKNWWHRLASGQLRYEISPLIHAKPAIHDEAIFGEKVDYVPKLMAMLESHRQPNGAVDDVSLDVIVPVYNAYDDVLRCLYSLLKHQDIYRIILLDDCSTDARVKGLLHLLGQHQNAGFTVETNSRNLGYLRTANKGMRMTRSDVILLNSDTVVTAGWAQKMRACAHSDDGIATVTPFTNNGRMCSVPNFLGDNEIPKGFTVDSFAACVEDASSNAYPELVTAVGFCMYIRRSIINEIGYFDELNFGAGYGEEVDFSFRAARKGYKNVLCDNTFVFHRGGASFLDTRVTALLKHNKMVKKKYPELWDALASFERSNPLKSLHNRLKVEMKRQRVRRRKTYAS